MPAHSEGFRVDRAHLDGVAAFRLIGELDLAAEPALQAALDDAPVGPDSVVEFHMKDLTFMDSTGLRCITLCRDRVKHVVLVEPTANVRRVLEIGGLASVFEIRLAPSTIPEVA